MHCIPWNHPLGRMRNAASIPDEQRATKGSALFTRGLPELRQRPIRNPDDYQIVLPEWLRQCIANVPPGAGQSCPTDPEALLVSAFDFGFQLHEGQFRASGDPYIAINIRRKFSACAS